MRHSYPPFPFSQWLRVTGLLAALSVCPLVFGQTDSELALKLSRSAPVTLNFVNAEIEAVARTLLAETEYERTHAM